MLAQTPPTKHRPGTFYKVAEGKVTLYGKTYRAVVVHSSSQDQRRQKHLEREIQASYATLEATVREAARQEYCCHADAEAAAAKLRALQSAYHWVKVDVAERPKYGPGRPSRTQPRRVKAVRYGLQVTRHEQSEVIARKTPETGCFVLLTHVPTAGEMAHRAGDVLQAYKEQHGIEQNFGFLKDPLIVNSLFLKKPERIEALGLVLLLALLLWRLIEKTLRVHWWIDKLPIQPEGTAEVNVPRELDKLLPVEAREIERNPDAVPVPVRVFVSYARDDERQLKRLDLMLDVLEQQHELTSWQDTRLIAGDEWDKEIRSRLEDMDIFLFIASQTSLVRPYIKDPELRRAQERHTAGEVETVVVKLEPCASDEDPFLGKLQRLAPRYSSIAEVSPKSKAWEQVRKDLLPVIQRVRKRKADTIGKR